jgi:hypothetical protein
VLRSFLRHLAVGVGAVGVLVFTATHTRPLYLSDEPVAARLMSRDAVPAGVLASIVARAPWIHVAEGAVGTPQFASDSTAFVADLLGTGKVSQARAEELANVAVRQAYRRRVPPALVFGVMLTENDELKSRARSKVGAVGLMQIHGKAWVRPLGKIFGTNLRDDATNLKYGVFILGHLLESYKERDPARASLQTDDHWRIPLLGYNGCVKGTNTKGCHGYPDVVRRNVTGKARELCRGQNFEACVVQPIWASFQVEERAPSTRGKPDTSSSAGPVAQVADATPARSKVKAGSTRRSAKAARSSTTRKSASRRTRQRASD